MKAFASFNPDEVGVLAVVGPEQSEIAYGRTTICLINRHVMVIMNGKSISLEEFLELPPSKREAVWKGTYRK